ncbi:hypothetical protein KIPB_009896, partial [Kipferlia bialata]|eukprot:g9896.t1
MHIERSPPFNKEALLLYRLHINDVAALARQSGSPVSIRVKMPPVVYSAALCSHVVTCQKAVLAGRVDLAERGHTRGLLTRLAFTEGDVNNVIPPIEQEGESAAITATLRRRAKAEESNRLDSYNSLKAAVKNAQNARDTAARKKAERAEREKAGEKAGFFHKKKG